MAEALFVMSLANRAIKNYGHSTFHTMPCTDDWVSIVPKLIYSQLPVKRYRYLQQLWPWQYKLYMLTISVPSTR